MTSFAASQRGLHALASGTLFIEAAFQASASNPLRSTKFSSFSDGPVGCLSPRSHFCTVDGLVFK